MSEAEGGIYALESPSLDRTVQVGIAGSKVISVSFPETAAEDAAGDHPLLDRIDRYLGGEREDFRDVEVGLTVPTDHRSVLERLRTVPYGESVTVEALARMSPGIDPEEDLETVRAALRDNPVPLVIPDHRVSGGPSGAPPSVVGRLRSIEGL